MTAINHHIENIPVVKYVAVAGKNITLDCPGVNERSLVETLIWRTSHTIAEYVNGLPLVSNQRVSVSGCLSGVLCRGVAIDDDDDGEQARDAVGIKGRRNRMVW
uniref:Uncharacterized protein n=1 Tax=Anopheles maculatus TaxID=74869 RepID=A0A182SBZ5_9DIPT